MELETFRDIVCQQIDTLQSYFDACAGAGAGAGGNHRQSPHADSHDLDVFGSNDACKSIQLVLHVHVCVCEHTCMTSFLLV